MKTRAILGLGMAVFLLSLAAPDGAHCKNKSKKWKPLGNPAFTKMTPRTLRFAAYEGKLPRKLEMNFWVKNKGRKTAKVVHVKVRGLDKAARWKSLPVKIKNLHPGASKIAKCSLVVPKGTSRGLYKFRAFLSCARAVRLRKKHHKLHRTRTGSVQVKGDPTLCNLQIWGVRRKQVKKRKHVPLFKTGWIRHRFCVTVKNTGNGTSKPTDLRIDTWTWLRKKLPGLKKGKHREYFATLEVPAIEGGRTVTLACKKSYLCVHDIPVNVIYRVDASRKVREQNEKNNVFVSSYGYGLERVGIFVARYKGAPNKSKK